MQSPILEYFAINFDTRMGADVHYVRHRADGKKYRVTLRDLDSDSIIYPIIFYTTLSAATDKADALANVSEIAQ